MNSNFQKGFKKRKSSSKLEVKFFDVWSHMQRRCKNKNDGKYKHYGERGIVCEWATFSQFYEDMFAEFIKHIKKHGPKNTSLDRIDCNKNYSRQNCRWATQKVQQNNRRNNKQILFDGVFVTLSQLSDLHSIPYKRLWERLIKHKMPMSIALSKNDLRY